MMPTPWKEPPSVDLMEGERSPLARFHVHQVRETEEVVRERPCLPCVREERPTRGQLRVLHPHIGPRNAGTPGCLRGDDLPVDGQGGRARGL